MALSALLLIFVLLALPAILDHGGSFREVDDAREEDDAPPHPARAKRRP